MLSRAALNHAHRMASFRVGHHVGMRSSRYGRVTSSGGLSFQTVTHRWASSLSADEVMDNLQELYATAKDEFEMAAEETEKKTVYAADDREAAQLALKALKEAYEKSTKLSSPSVAAEIQGRVSQRIRELDNANTVLQEMAQED